MIFVFLTLLEFAFVNSYMRQANKYEKLSRALEKRQGGFFVVYIFPFFSKSLNL